MRNLLPLAVVVCCVAGCSSDDHDSDAMRQRQDAAMKDPYSYGPDQGKSSTAGDAGHLSKRDDSLKGQMDRFWNP